MQDHRSVAECDDQDDMAVLGLLLDDGERRVWSVEEIVREHGDRARATDSLARLVGAGLLHRCNGFVFATRPAVYYARLLA